MSGRIQNCKGPFYIYHLPRAKYIGVTSNIDERIKRHKYDRYVKDMIILKTFTNIHDALNYEYQQQVKHNYSCYHWTKNQSGIRNKNSRKIISNITGYIYNTIKEAADDCQINYNTLRSMLSQGRTDKFKYI